ncbi:MAG: ABC transporter substrate-binding protein [Clostridiales bacterium]|nr:ABC transporter substrate-binding protein [Clostridiales bacterium]
MNNKQTLILKRGSWSKANTFFALLLVLSLLVFAYSPVFSAKAQDAKKGPITVASFIDSEGAVIGGMMVLLLRDAGFEVNDMTEFGTPDILRKALMAGEVDLVLDYTGSGQYYHETDSQDVWSDAKLGYEQTRKLDIEANDIYWLTPASANNTEGLAVTNAFSQENNIKSIQDLADYVNAGGEVKLIASSSFVENIKGLVGFEEAYGFQLNADQLIVLASGNTAEMLKALTEGRDKVNVSLVYGTDGALKDMGLVVLDDPKSIPPVYQPSPVLRGELYRQYPEIEEILKPLFETLSLDALQTLNALVTYEGLAAKDVAKNYLVEQGLMKED